MKNIVLAGFGVFVQSITILSQTNYPITYIDWDKDPHGEAQKNNVRG
jgi:hypothetical protein